MLYAMFDVQTGQFKSVMSKTLTVTSIENMVPRSFKASDFYHASCKTARKDSFDSPLNPMIQMGITF